MSAARQLRAVAAPSPIPATPARAAAVYPQSDYLAAANGQQPSVGCK